MWSSVKERTVFSINGVGANDFYVYTMNLDSYLTLYIKINSKLSSISM